MKKTKSQGAKIMPSDLTHTNQQTGEGAGNVSMPPTSGAPPTKGATVMKSDLGSGQTAK